MIAEARRLNPEIPFHVGDMRSLPDPDGSWGGIAAFYCIIHIPREKVVQALGEMRRVLCPGGVLLIAFHIGDRVEHVEADDLADELGGGEAQPDEVAELAIGGAEGAPHRG